MGDPRRNKAKYQRPSHPWNAARIEVEKVMLKEYGLKNKTELWKLLSKLKRFKDLAKKLIAATGDQADKERKQLMSKLNRLGLIRADSPLDDVLGLELKDILERRLQTLVFRKGLAKTVNQARQFITHKHVTIGSNIMSTPSYLVTTKEEPSIQFVPSSNLASVDHPERAQKEAPAEKPEEKPAEEAKA